MKIAILNLNWVLGGPEKYGITLYEELKRQEYHTEIFAFKTNKGFNMKDMKYDGMTFLNRRKIDECVEILDKFDIIHLMSLGCWEDIGAIKAGKYPPHIPILQKITKPMVFTAHGINGISRWYKEYGPYVARMCSGGNYVRETTKEAIKKNVEGLEFDKNFHYIPIPIDLSDFEEIMQKETLIISPARMDYIKRQKWLLDEADKLHNNYSMIIYGDLSQRYYKFDMTKHKNHTLVNWQETYSNEQLKSILSPALFGYNVTDVIIDGVQDGGDVDTLMLEMMKYGVIPIILDSWEGILKDGINCITINKDNRNISDKIKALDGDKISEIITNNYKLVKEFDIRNLLPRFINMYEQAIKMGVTDNIKAIKQNIPLAPKPINEDASTTISEPVTQQLVTQPTQQPATQTKYFTKWDGIPSDHNPGRPKIAYCRNVNILNLRMKNSAGFGGTEERLGMLKEWWNRGYDITIYANVTKEDLEVFDENFEDEQYGFLKYIKYDSEGYPKDDEILFIENASNNLLFDKNKRMVKILQNYKGIVYYWLADEALKPVLNIEDLQYDWKTEFNVENPNEDLIFKDKHWVILGRCKDTNKLMEGCNGVRYKFKDFHEQGKLDVEYLPTAYPYWMIKNLFGQCNEHPIYELSYTGNERGRYRKLEKFYDNLNHKWHLFGKWGRGTLKGFNDCEYHGEFSHEAINGILKDTKMQFIIGDNKYEKYDWVTPRVFECLANGCLVFLAGNYIDNMNGLFPEEWVIRNEAEAKAVFDQIRDLNYEDRQSLLLDQREKIAKSIQLINVVDKFEKIHFKYTGNQLITSSKFQRSITETYIIYSKIYPETEPTEEEIKKSLEYNTEEVKENIKTATQEMYPVSEEEIEREKIFPCLSCGKDTGCANTLTCDECKEKAKEEEIPSDKIIKESSDIIDKNVITTSSEKINPNILSAKELPLEKQIKDLKQTLQEKFIQQSEVRNHLEQISIDIIRLLFKLNEKLESKLSNIE